MLEVQGEAADRRVARPGAWQAQRCCPTDAGPLVPPVSSQLAGPLPKNELLVRFARLVLPLAGAGLELLKHRVVHLSKPAG